MGNRLTWTGLLTASTSGALKTDDAAVRDTKTVWHAFVSGTLGGSTPVVQIQYTPNVVGETAQWYAPTQLQFTAAGDAVFFANPRQFRVVITGGDGTTLVNVEIR